MANMLPMAANRGGMEAGRHIARSRPVRAALPSCTVLGFVHDFIADGFKDNGRNNTSHHDNGGAHAEVINRSDDSRYKGPT